MNVHDHRLNARHHIRRKLDGTAAVTLTRLSDEAFVADFGQEDSLPIHADKVDFLFLDRLPARDHTHLPVPSLFRWLGTQQRPRSACRDHSGPRLGVELSTLLSAIGPASN